MQGRTLALMLLVAAVATAGCTSLFGGDGEDGPDVRITEDDGLSTTLTSLSSTYREGEDIGIRLAVTNTGESPARDITARLFGPLFLNVDTCGDMYRDVATRLTGVDRAAAQDGQETAVEWTCTNPVDLPAGETRDVRAGAAVAYTYNTTASASFRVVPRETFTGTSSPVTTDSSASPLDVEIDLSSPVTLTPPDDDDEPVETFNISRVIADAEANTLTVVFNHPIDTGDFDLLADLRAFEITTDGVSIDTDALTVDDVQEDRVVFPVSGDMSATGITLQATASWIDLENTANDQAFTRARCQFSVGTESAETESCSQQSWRPVSYYWQDLKIDVDGEEGAAYLRMSQDLGDFRLPDGDYTEAIEIENASTHDPTPHVNFTGSISTVSGSPNIVKLALETSGRDLTGEEIDITWLPQSGFGFISGESDMVMDTGSCSAPINEGYHGLADGGQRHCASATEEIQIAEGKGIAVPVRIRNVGDGMVGDIEQEPRSVDFTASIPNAPEDVSVHSCLGSTEFPTAFDLFDGNRDITCSVVLPEEAYDTQMTIRISMEYQYVETVETGFTLEGVP